MIEKVGNKDVVIRDYTSNFNIKQYIKDVLIPEAFPDIPVAKLNLGFTGIVSEMISQAIEDSYGTASLMMNESFPTRAQLPNSIYSSASLFNLGYAWATPSKCNFAVELWMEDILNYSTKVRNTQTYRYRLDKDTTILLGNNTYRFDYDVIIDHQFIDGQRVFNVYYDIDETNSIANVTSKYVKHQTSSIGWLVLFVELQEYKRKVVTASITDNLVTTNSDIQIKWAGQIAGLDLVYITPTGERKPMMLKTKYTKEEIDPFAWYQFYDENTITLSFSNNKSYFSPAFNSKIESTIYTCTGASANFDEYDRTVGLPVQQAGERFEYNSNTQMAALCYSGSVGGTDIGDIELLRQDVINAYNTANVLTTDHDLKLWFERYAKKNGTHAEFFKRRDDPSGRLFSQFISIVDNTYVYPTNTLNLKIDESQFDFVNNDDDGIGKEFIIKPGHLWEYADDENDISRDTVRMVNGTNGMAMITDDALPQLSSTRPFMFVNPFYIKISRDPMMSGTYNCLINHTSWPEDVPVGTSSFYQFQLATLSIERSLSKKNTNNYHIEVICVPVVSSTTMKYVDGIGDKFPVNNNRLRLIMLTRSAADGETGYIELTPTEERTAGSYLFETDITIYDNIQSDMIEINLDQTPGMKSLITTGPRQGKVVIDAAETSLHFMCLIKGDNEQEDPVLGDESYRGYILANRFANIHRDLTLYRPMNMIRSTVEFSGESGSYNVSVLMTPLLKYDIALDDSKMLYFIRAFDEQYRAMEGLLENLNGEASLDGNASIDFKLYNTYGRSTNYYIGPKDGEPSLWTSDILLDNVYVKIKLIMSVYDRSIYAQTLSAVITDIQSYFDSLYNGDRKDIHISDIMHNIIANQPNVRYIRFLGFNDYDANKQAIFVKYNDISELKKGQLMPHVPEMIRADANSIEITEEV